LKPPAWAAAAFESGPRQSTEEEKGDNRAAETPAYCQHGL
ncbi:hypothetical protein OFN32_39865, partial [Escherichia coli]|nr:hypothetical protein [Escherichia coli]